jgi:hypothetical protein
VYVWSRIPALLITILTFSCHQPLISFLKLRRVAKEIFPELTDAVIDLLPIIRGPIAASGPLVCAMFTSSASSTDESTSPSSPSAVQQRHLSRNAATVLHTLLMGFQPQLQAQALVEDINFINLYFISYKYMSMNPIPMPVLTRTNRICTRPQALVLF